MLAVLVPAATFVVFTLVIFFGLTVAGAIGITRVLAVVELVLAGGIFGLNFRYRRQINKWLDGADAIEAKFSGDDLFAEWDEFVAVEAGDPEVERIRVHCLRLPREFPPTAGGAYCSDEGIEIMQGYVTRLRVGLVTRAVEECSTWWSQRRAARKPDDADTPADDASGGGECIPIPDPVTHPVLTEIPQTAEGLTPTLPDDAEPDSARMPTTRHSRKPATTKKVKRPQTAKTTNKQQTTKKAKTAKTTRTTRAPGRNRRVV